MIEANFVSPGPKRVLFEAITFGHQVKRLWVQRGFPEGYFKNVTPVGAHGTLFVTGDRTFRFDWRPSEPTPHGEKILLGYVDFEFEHESDLWVHWRNHVNGNWSSLAPDTSQLVLSTGERYTYPSLQSPFVDLTGYSNRIFRYSNIDQESVPATFILASVWVLPQTP